ncbi:MAG: 16S rRNA (guanine(966)-N(2))-methyltransferase RsmD [Candidatus Margulisiibacteriota bacterium]
MKTPKKGWGIRPLTDQARGALFNILAVKNAEASFLDVFAGTGAVGIEALSRGAQTAIFVELGRPAADLIRQNLALAGCAGQAEIFNMDAVRAISFLGGKGAQFDIIFLGAPYDNPVLEKVMAQVAAGNLLKPDGVMVAEHRRQHQLAETVGNLVRMRDARYGETVLSFYKGQG